MSSVLCPDFTFSKKLSTVMKKAQKVPKKEAEKKLGVFELWFQLSKASHDSEVWIFDLYRFFLKFVRRYDIIGQVIVTL
jgi:hypothetical protein